MKKALNFLLPFISIYLGNFLLTLVNNQLNKSGGNIYQYIIYAIDLMIGVSFALFVIYSVENHMIAINIIVLLLLLVIAVFFYKGLPAQIIAIKPAIDFGMQREKLMMMWLGVSGIAAIYEIKNK